MSYFDGDIRDLGQVDEVLLRPLDEYLRDRPSIWDEADRLKPNRYECFESNTLHVVFQFPLENGDHTRSVTYPFWPQWRPAIQPIIDSLVGSFGYALGRTSRIMLAKLKAGRSIQAHIDKPGSCEAPHKIHVPVVTDPMVRFYVEDRDYLLERGRAYEVNNRVMHHVVNRSALDRVHLVFDYYDSNVKAAQVKGAPGVG